MVRVKNSRDRSIHSQEEQRWRRGLLLLLTALVFTFVAACGSEEEDSDGLSGTVEVTYVHYDDGGTGVEHELHPRGLGKSGLGEGEGVELSFSKEPALANGDRVRVVGDEVDGVFHVTDYSLLDDDPDVRAKAQALAGNQTRQTSRLAVFLVHWNSPNSLTPAEMRRRVFTNEDATREFFHENAYDLVDLEGDVFGWYQIPDPGGCDSGQIAQSARSAAIAAGVDLDDYDQFLFYFPRTSACGWSGLGQVGRPKRPSRNTWYNGSAGCVVLAHELLHNFGARHSRSYTCSQGGSRVPFADPSSCDYSEYGDRYDVMGGGCFHTNAYQKASQGWWGGCNGVTTTSDVTFDIVPTETASDDIQSVRIPMAGSLCPPGLSSCYYYVEYKQPVGEFSSRSQAHEGVLLHVGGDADFAGNSSPRSPYLLDMHPSSSSFSDAALEVGEVFRDPTGIEITLLSRTSQAARVSVSFPGGGSGSPLCIDGSTPPGIEPPPPGNCEPGEVEFDDNCYFLSGSATSYAAARSTCEDRGDGWRLAEIQSAAENNFVASLSGGLEVWLGATDSQSEGSFRWESGTQFWAGGLGGEPTGGQYANFISSEPNDGGGNSDCLRMISGGGWRDISCGSNYRAACEESGDSPPAPTCADGVQNQDESDIDCGGVCLSCSDGRTCGFDADCQSNRCVSGVCVAAPTCNDGVRNGDESDVDCGGSCPACADGASCAGDDDCLSGDCTGGTCTSVASCSDGVRNGDESDVDCGGSCSPCADGGACGAASDCASGDCAGGTCVPAVSCTDGVKNGSETDIDCGGSCAPCANGKDCGSASDCQSNTCAGGVCVTPPTGGEVTATLVVRDEWEGGYCVDLYVSNDGSSATSSWGMEVDLNQSTLGSSWNVNLSQVGSVVTATPLGWNASVAAGSSMNVWGFCGAKTGNNWQPELTSFSSQ